MRILLVSQMYPGPRDPDLGAFIAQIDRELQAQGHEIVRAVIDHRGGSRLKYARLAGAALTAATRRRPDVVFAHFLAPAGTVGAVASLAARAPLVAMAHGQDVRNIGEVPGVRAATRMATRRAAAVVANSDFLRRALVEKLPELAGRVEVIDCGVDMVRFQGGDAGAARRRLGWEGSGPFFLCVGALEERKNVHRLADAFARLDRGQLALVGDGSLRGSLEGRASVRLVGRVPNERVADWMAACDVLCQPSLVEPFGQAALEAMASERTVVASREGGPPEFVTLEAGVLVDPRSVDSIAAGMQRAAELPAPNPAARRAAAEHDVKRQAGRMAELLERAVSRKR